MSTLTITPIVRTLTISPTVRTLTIQRGGATPTGPAGGDLGGAYPSPMVAGILGSPIDDALIDDQRILVYREDLPLGARWEFESKPSGTVSSITAGTGLTGGTITTSGTIAANFGTAAGTVCQGNDARLSDARTPTAHKSSHAQLGSDPLSPSDIGAADALHGHGQISTAGTIGSTANLPLITRTGGEIITGTFGTGAATFCEGNDARLSNARTPTGSAGGDLTGTYPNPTIANQAVTYAKMQHISAHHLLGRNSGNGVIQEQPVTAFAFGLLDDVDAAAARTTLGLGAVDTNTNATFYPVFVTAAGATVPHVDVTTTPLSYNPSTGQMSMRNLRVGLGVSTYIDFSGPTAGFTCVSSTDQFAVLPNSFQHSGSNRFTVYSDNAVDFYSDTDDITFQTPTTGKKAKFWSTNIARHVGVWHDATNGYIESTLGNLNLVSAGDINNNGNRIPKVFSGTTAPSAGTGTDGDLYFQY